MAQPGAENGAGAVISDVIRPVDRHIRPLSDRTDIDTSIFRDVQRVTLKRSGVINWLGGRINFRLGLLWKAWFQDDKSRI